MADITAAMVRELRDRTGAGMMDCKRALEEAGGDTDKAIALLRERGLAAAAKKAGRDAQEGLVSSYIHTGGRVGVLIEVNCETDFVARTDQFQELVRLLAIQVAGLNPRWVDVDSIPAEELAAKKAELAKDPTAASKPAEIREKIVDGHPKACLHRATFIIDKKGVVRHILSDVNPKEHVEEVLKVCRQLLNGHAN